MARDELAVMVNLEYLAFGLDFHAFSGQTVRNRVAIGLEGDQAVLGNVPDGPLLDDIRRSSLRRVKEIFFLEKHLGGLPVGGSVDPLISDSHDPLQKTGVEMIEAFKQLSPQEPFDVLDARFNFALCLRPVGTVRPRLEAIAPAEVPEDRIPLEARALKVPLQDDRLEVVVNDLMGNAAQMRERGLMALEEGRELLIPRRDGEHPPAVAQGHDEQMDLGLLPPYLRPALTPVGLGLASGRRLEADRRLDRGLGPQRTHEPLHHVVASPITSDP